MAGAERGFRSEVLIGSKCTAGNTKPSEDNVVDQILALTMMHTDYKLPSDSDILIEHAFEDVSTLDFGKVEYVINRGYSDAIDAMPLIKERITRRVDLIRCRRLGRLTGLRCRTCFSTSTRFPG